MASYDDADNAPSEWLRARSRFAYRFVVYKLQQFMVLPKTCINDAAAGKVRRVGPCAAHARVRTRMHTHPPFTQHTHKLAKAHNALKSQAGLCGPPGSTYTGANGELGLALFDSQRGSTSVEKFHSTSKKLIEKSTGRRGENASMGRVVLTC